MDLGIKGRRALVMGASKGLGRAIADSLAEEAVRLLGGVDILVLNHGGPPPGTATEVTEAQLAEWFPRMVLHPIRVAMRLLPAMRAQKWGRIVIVGSSGMVEPIPNLAISNTLRGAIVGWSKSLAGEVAGDGVTCNILAPGAILTDRLKETQAGAAAKRGMPVDQVIAERASTIPAKRIGVPAEFGPMGAFLASERAAYVTGTIVRVDGGAVRGH